MDKELMANVTLRAQVHTVDDLRELVGYLNKYGVRSDIEVEFDKDNVWVDLSGFGTLPAEWIECGDHIPPSNGWDVIIDMHKHPDSADVPMFDWPTKDRLNRYDDLTRPE